MSRNEEKDRRIEGYRRNIEEGVAALVAKVREIDRKLE